MDESADTMISTLQRVHDALVSRVDNKARETLSELNRDCKKLGDENTNNNVEYAPTGTEGN